MKRILLIVMMLMMVLNVGCGDQSQDKSKSTSKKIVVGLDENYPPYGFRDENNEIVGFDIDLAKATMKKLGKEVEFKPINWNDKEVELDSGKIDIIWNGLNVTAERKEVILFSRPYMNDRFVIVVKNSNTSKEINSKEKLKDLRIGIQNGSSVEDYINQDDYLFHNVKVQLYTDNSLLFDALFEDKIDAILIDDIHCCYFVKENKLEDRVDLLYFLEGTEDEIAIGFRKNDEKLCNEIQNAFDEIVKDGTAKEISEKWLGKNVLIDN